MKKMKIEAIPVTAAIPAIGETRAIANEVR